MTTGTYDQWVTWVKWSFWYVVYSAFQVACPFSVHSNLGLTNGKVTSLPFVLFSHWSIPNLNGH